MKQAFRLSCAAAFFVLFVGATITIYAQTTPDPFVAQISSSDRQSYAGDINGNGRFVVIESTGDISTEKTAGRNNADANREIFLFDYAQRRIFQITNTTSARVDTTKPAIDPATPLNFSNIKVEVSNNKPVISNNGRWIAFNSNASTPGSFNGDTNSAALITDGNQEIFIYLIPATTDVDLSNGADPVPLDLANGTFTRVTDTPASRAPVPGTATSTPFVAFDNRDAAVNDNASVVAFVSTRDLVGNNNADANPEIFIYRRNPTPATIVQMTVTGSTTLPNFIFNENPSLSGNGSVVAFLSNANISAGGSTNNADGNAEVYLGSFDGTTAAVTRQVTRTTTPFAGIGVNFLPPGRRLSRDGNLIALESLANLSGDNANNSTTTVFIYRVSSNSFTQVGPRAATSSALRFPTFTDYDATTLQPATLIFSSGLNFKADGTIPTAAADGLNPGGGTQIFSVPVSTPTTFTRLTNTPAPPFFPGPTIQPFGSNTRQRLAFSIEATELGGLNTDNSAEAFYLVSRQGTNVANATASFLTGASGRAVVTPSPTPPAVQGLAPGMLGIVRSATPLAPSNQTAGSASESAHRPSLPIELNGVSVSINNAAAGLFFVSPGEIQFVVPPGLAATAGTATYPVVINNNGSIIRATIQIFPAQPDIFTQTNAFGTNRAVVTNVTNPTLSVGTPEPFMVITTYVNGQGQTVTAPTKLRIFLTGVRRVTDKAQITVRIGTTDLTGAAIVLVAPTDTPGTDQIDVTLPATLATAGDVPVIVTVVKDGATTSSRPAASAPLIRIN